MKPSIYFNEEPCKEAKKILLEYFKEVTHRAIVDSDVIWTGLRVISRRHQVVATPCTGIDHIEAKEIVYLDEEFKSDIGDTVTSTAEHTLSLMLQLAKKAKIQLAGKTLGIIGYGRIGGLVGDYCNALGMKILAYDIKGHGNCELDKLLELSDVISIHIPLKKNKDFFDYEFFFRYPNKNNCLIINTSRQEIFNIIDLEAMITSNDIYYADDFKNEINFEKDYPDRVVQTPHIGGNCKEAREITDIWLAKKLIRYFKEKEQVFKDNYDIVDVINKMLESDEIAYFNNGDLNYMNCEIKKNNMGYGFKVSWKEDSKITYKTINQALKSLRSGRVDLS